MVVILRASQVSKIHRDVHSNISSSMMSDGGNLPVTTDEESVQWSDASLEEGGSGSNAPSTRKRIDYLTLCTDRNAFIIKRSFPVFFTLMILALWLTYLLGVVFSRHLKMSDISLNGPLSPPSEDWFFFTVKPYPSCKDLRSEWWRLFSMQFVHGN